MLLIARILVRAVSSNRLFTAFPGTWRVSWLSAGNEALRLWGPCETQLSASRPPDGLLSYLLYSAPAMC